MATITATMVKDLRERTGAGMMDCKKALAEVDGDMEAAIDWLRTKGLAAAAKKADRIAAEGLVGVNVNGTQGALVEVNAETDFVARNDTFQDFVETVSKLALNSDSDIEKLKEIAFPGESHSTGEQLTKLIASIGENMNLRRCAALSVSDGVVGDYLHNSLKPGLGRIGVIVALESTGDKAKLLTLAKQIAMHAAAANPQSTTVENLDPEMVKRERAVLTEQAIASGKPAEFVDKMVEGRLRKYYEEVVLAEQVFVIDGETKIKDVLKKAESDVGAPITLKGFVRFALGEGIEKKSEDFASEVAAQLGN